MCPTWEVYITSVPAGAKADDDNNDDNDDDNNDHDNLSGRGKRARTHQCGRENIGRSKRSESTVQNKQLPHDS